MTTTGTTRPNSDWLMALSSILPHHIMHPVAAKTFQTPGRCHNCHFAVIHGRHLPHHPFLTGGQCGLPSWTPSQREGSHCGEQSGNKLLSVRSAFILVRPDERLSDFKQPQHVWGSYSHFRCGALSHTANTYKHGIKNNFSVQLQ